jgi:hypothetical protein
MALTPGQKRRIDVGVAERNTVPTGGKKVSDAIAGLVTAGALAPIATADATDLATAEALANACKAKINAILAALAAGV